MIGRLSLFKIGCSIFIAKLGPKLISIKACKYYYNRSWCNLVQLITFQILTTKSTTLLKIILINSVSQLFHMTLSAGLCSFHIYFNIILISTISSLSLYHPLRFRNIFLTMRLRSYKHSYPKKA